jgi:hypothetical protein
MSQAIPQPEIATTLAAANSLFQLGVGVNAVLPLLIADFETVRDRTAESLLRKIKEFKPDFDIKERDRQEFVSFVLRSTRGLRVAKWLTGVMGAVSLALSGISLVALYYAAIEPSRNISTEMVRIFISVTLVGAPVLYVSINYLYKQLYAAMAAKASNERNEAILMAGSIEAHLRFKNEMDPLFDEIDKMTNVTIPLAVARMRWFHFRIAVKRSLFKLRSQLGL